MTGAVNDRRVNDRRRTYRHAVSEPQMTQSLAHLMPRGRTTTTVALLAAAFTLTACGGSGAGAASTPTTTPAARQARGGVQGAAFPGANGQIAAISGRTLQVRSPQSGQVAVSWTATTRFSRTVPVTGSAVTVGSCVDVRTDAATSSSGSAPATDVTATSITVSNPVKGSCSTERGGFGAGGGPGFGGGAGRPSGFPSGAPSGFPSGRPGGRTGNGTGFARPVVGQVTAVRAGVLTVAAVDVAVPAPGTTGTSGTPTSDATVTSPVTVRTTATTTWTRTTTGTAKDLAVGQCVTALGKADDTGAVTATTIATRPAQDGQCAIGFGRGGATSTGNP
jgi:hypothetical protein